MVQQLIEERPEWVHIMRILDTNGARVAPGWRVRQSELVAAVGVLNEKRVREYLKAMERYGLLTIRRTTVDGSFGSPRGFNIYHLKVTPDEWLAKLAPAFIERRRTLLHNRMSAHSRNREAEKKRLAAPRSPRKEQPTPRARVLDPETVAVLAAEYDDDTDEELAGW